MEIEDYDGINHNPRLEEGYGSVFITTDSQLIINGIRYYYHNSGAGVLKLNKSKIVERQLDEIARLNKNMPPEGIDYILPLPERAPVVLKRVKKIEFLPKDEISINEQSKPKSLMQILMGYIGMK